MFVRFVVLERDEHSCCARGVFQALYGLRDRGALLDYEVEWFRETARWFDRHLGTPARLSRSSHSHAQRNAIRWFRHTARRHIAKMWDLMALLEHHGVASRMLATRRPGYVVYEDAHQLAAVPFRNGAGRGIS
jgi:hypothetical protein